MKNSIFTVLAALVLYPAGAQPVTPQDRRRAAELVERMTLDEKIGQLVQQRGGGAVTGPDKTELSVERLVREGRCGSVFNIKSFEETERLQRIAVEESRLGIPLLIGADVIHGFRTIFPINLAVAASWDPAAAESLARVSAPIGPFRRCATFRATPGGAVSPRARAKTPIWARVSPKRWCGAIRATCPTPRRSLPA